MRGRDRERKGSRDGERSNSDRERDRERGICGNRKKKGICREKGLYIERKGWREKK